MVVNGLLILVNTCSKDLVHFLEEIMEPEVLFGCPNNDEYAVINDNTDPGQVLCLCRKNIFGAENLFL